MRQALPGPVLWTDFLAKYEMYQALIAKKVDLNCQKRVWSTKRQLGLKAAKRPRGAQLGNRNALKHGFHTPEQRASLALFAAFFRALDASKRASSRPRSATASGL